MEQILDSFPSLISAFAYDEQLLPFIDVPPSRSSSEVHLPQETLSSSSTSKSFRSTERVTQFSTDVSSKHLVQPQIPTPNTTPSSEPKSPEQFDSLIKELNLAFDSYRQEPSIPEPIIKFSSWTELENLEPLMPVNTYNCCDANSSYPYRKNIMFIKVHKCASGTVQNILMRFGLRHDLNFLLPFFFYITYYEPYKEDFTPMETRTIDSKYHILTHPTRYGSNLKTFMYADTVSVTILRSPASVFESKYNYFMLNSMLGKSFSEFMKSPYDIQSPIRDTMPVYRGFNQMSMDLGLDQMYFENQTAIRSFIQYIDEEFDFVMMVEYFDESLVMLAQLMGWPLDHVAYVPINKRRQGVKYYLTESDREILSDLNKADTLLYDYFLKKFQKCRQQFGVDRLQEEVNKLRKLNEALREKCVFAEHIVPIFDVVGYDMKNFTDWECIYSTKYEYFFTQELKFRQSQRILLNRTAYW